MEENENYQLDRKSGSALMSGRILKVSGHDQGNKEEMGRAHIEI